MSAAAGTALQLAQDLPSDLPSPADRGTLEVADRVVERVAGYAVTLVPEATAAPRRVLGVNVGSSRTEDEASVSASVHGGTATVEATVAVRWPASVRAVADQVRRVVREEVAATTGVRVDHVDLEVTSLDVPVRRGPRVR
ncbi:Asp23/Gls24 family envelope stress response protein [Quadrisphaera sp. DSM 44207]|uniref:Asp23/Gls24 family envelope stress response protein n=1 Tax=Quadrisphaera sp. DSM 44207 TaxID=1881057 RepID=UPI000889019B|nr:Asp23/Gls24 family envelope stress response protein [Quadrisphaera sp. DSM 44207]SDQ85574.1 Uncharacterized conserved protein YloU, alkaline shock protein (Asp23) family [Quadrisphaera sp. DSM 44207]